MNKKYSSRRKFIYTTGITALGLPLVTAFGGCSSSSKNKNTMNNKKLGVALVGLGSYASGQLAPALQQTKHCCLAGIVTGTPSKAAAWKEKYNIPGKNIYSYNNYDAIKDNPDIDIIYVVLPNSMHAEYTIRGFEAGKHVICEKPMAVSVAECDAMLAAAKKAGKHLSIGYRLHFDPYNLEMVRLAKEKVYGNVTKVTSGFGFNAQKGIWRLNKKYAGGGPLMDLGIYCLQGVMYVTGMHPVAVTAQQSPISDATKFIDIEETLTWQMEMPDGTIAECVTSYTDNHNFLKATAANGWFQISPAFNYDGLKGITSDGKTIAYPPLSQQAKQLDGIALSVKNKTPSIVPGEMGRRDMRIIEAIYEAMKTGKRITIPA
jgi:predicted dehydrogenase